MDDTIPIRDELDILAQKGNFEIITDLGDYVSNIVGLILLLAGVIVFLYLVWGGIKWLTAGSDATKVEEARTHLTNAIIGLAIVASSWATFVLLDYFFGLNIAGESDNTEQSPSTPRSGGGRPSDLIPD